MAVTKRGVPSTCMPHTNTSTPNNPSTVVKLLRGGKLTRVFRIGSTGGRLNGVIFNFYAGAARAARAVNFKATHHFSTMWMKERPAWNETWFHGADRPMRVEDIVRVHLSVFKLSKNTLYFFLVLSWQIYEELDFAVNEDGERMRSLPPSPDAVHEPLQPNH